MGSKKKAPPPPDYKALAKEQAALNSKALQEQTVANRPDQVNALGSIKWTQDPATGKWTQTETLNPQVQQALEQSLALQGKQISQIGDLMNKGGFQGGPALPTYNPAQINRGEVPNYTPYANGVPQFNATQINRGDIPEYNQAYADDYANKFTESLLARVAPQQSIDRERMETQLRLKGLQPGTEAYDRAYQNLLRSQGDVTAQATLQGQLAGAGEARNMYSTALTGQQQDYAQQLGLSGANIANYQAMLAGQGQGFEQNLASYQAQLAGQQQDYAQQLGLGQFGLDQYTAQLAGQQQGYNQQLQNYLLPWQTASATQGLANNITMPNFQNFATSGMAQTPDMLGAAQQQYAQQVQQVNEANASKSGKGQAIGTVVGGVGGFMLGGPAGAMAGASLGGAAGGAIASDAALKNTIVPLSDEECYNKMVELVPVSWRWNGTGVTDSGIIAQEVEKLIPEVVGRHAAGHLVVGYTQLFAILLGAFRHLAQKERERAHADA